MTSDMKLHKASDLQLVRVEPVAKILHDYKVVPMSILLFCAFATRSVTTVSKQFSVSRSCVRHDTIAAAWCLCVCQQDVLESALVVATTVGVDMLLDDVHSTALSQDW